jgi:hypothetical protein
MQVSPLVLADARRRMRGKFFFFFFFKTSERGLMSPVVRRDRRTNQGSTRRHRSGSHHKSEAGFQDVSGGEKGLAFQH